VLAHDIEVGVSAGVAQAGGPVPRVCVLQTSAGDGEEHPVAPLRDLTPSSSSSPTRNLRAVLLAARSRIVHGSSLPPLVLPVLLCVAGRRAQPLLLWQQGGAGAL
jgi:hypothetical protein